jgi:flagellar basal body-associated protein FliL
MTQTPEPNQQPTEPPTVAMPQPAASAEQPASPYAAPVTSPASPYGVPVVQPASPYAAPVTPPASPYGAPAAQPAAAQPASPYGAPGVPSSPYAQPASPYGAPNAQPPAQPGSPYAATPQGSAPDLATAAYGMPPVSSQPAYGTPPIPGQPGQPVSSQPAYGLPYTEQPLSAPPYGMAPAQPPKPRRTGLIALAIVAALLFASGGVLGGLLVAQRGETDRARTEIAAQKQKIAEHETEIDNLKVNLDSVNSKNLLTQQELDGSKNDRAEQERQKKVVAKCLDLLLDVFASTSQSQIEKRLKAADKTCDEADRYR